MGKTYVRHGKWWISYRTEGREYRQSVARLLRVPVAEVTERMAKAALEQVTRAIHQDRWVEPTYRTLTLAECLEALRVNMELRRVKRLRAVSGVFRRIAQEHGRVRAQDIGAATLERWAQAWLTRPGRPLAPATVKQLCDFIAQALRLAVTHQRLAQAPKSPRIRIDNARQGFATPEQCTALLEALRAPRWPRHAPHPVYADVAEWLVLTGWRGDEALRLTWEQVDRAGGEVRLVETKNGEARVLPLVGPLAALIEARWRGRGLGVGWVFHRDGRPVTDTRFRKHFRRAARRIGLPDLTPHDLRRSMARNLEQAGVPRSVAMRIGGWKSESLYRRYAIANTADVADALRRVHGAGADNNQGQRGQQIGDAQG